MFKVKPPFVQRQADREEEVEPAFAKASANKPAVDEALEDKDESVQAKINNDEAGTADPSMEQSINQSQGQGESLSTDTREFMEGQFGMDLSNVTVHNDSNAAQLNKQLNAQAFTKGSDIYFNEGKYDPDSSQGKHLLAHELTHVVQQNKRLGSIKGVQKNIGSMIQRRSKTDPRLPLDLSEAKKYATVAIMNTNKAKLKLGSEADPKRKNVPDYINQQGITLSALTPRDDSATKAGFIHFFTGDVDYSNSMTLPESATHHLEFTGAAIYIRARDHNNIDKMLPAADIEHRLVQAVTEFSHISAAKSKAPKSFNFESYRAMFNSLWSAPVFAGKNSHFNPALSSMGPRTDRSRAIFEHLYKNNPDVKTIYDLNANVREQIDSYTGPEGLNPINSPRLQSLRSAFFSFSVPVSNKQYPGFKLAIQTAANKLDDTDRKVVESSNEWQLLINEHLKAESKRNEISVIIATPPPSPSAAKPKTPPPKAAVIKPGLSVTPQKFIDSVSIDGPKTSVLANARTEKITLIPRSTVANPAVNIDTQFNVTPKNKVEGGKNISPPTSWPHAKMAGVPFVPTITNSGTISMTAHLDLVNGPAGLKRTSPIPDLIFTLVDNRKAHFKSNWYSDVLFKTAAGQEWLSTGSKAQYLFGTQNFEVGAFLPAPMTNPGLSLFVRVRLKRGTKTIAAPKKIERFRSGRDAITYIPINITKPGTIPITGDVLTFEIELLDSDQKTIVDKNTHTMTVFPEKVITKAQLTKAAGDDDKHFHDNSSKGLLGQMTKKGGLAARVANAINETSKALKITLRPLTPRHDSAAYVKKMGKADPSKVGYFVGTTYKRSFVSVAGAVAFYIPSGYGPRFIVANRTTDIVGGTPVQRKDPKLIDNIVHEALHAMDVRPKAHTNEESYKTEFRAYWMDGTFGPPNKGTCPPPKTPYTTICPPIGSKCFDTNYRPNIPPPGPKSCRAQQIFMQLYGSTTYPWMKKHYDKNTKGFRRVVDNYLIPDGINLIVSIRLEALRQLISRFKGGGYNKFERNVQAYMGVGPGPVPKVGMLDADEQNEVRNNRAWRDLVNRKVTKKWNRRNKIKNILKIPT